MPADSLVEHVEAFIAEAQRIVSEHCDSDKQAAFLREAQRNAAYRRLNELGNAVYDDLRQRLGENAARQLHEGVMARVRRMLNWADHETYHNPEMKQDHKAGRLAALRREFKTSDLTWLYDELRRAATPDTPPEPSDDSHLSPAKLAEVFGVQPDPLRTRLNRWRARNHTGWIENPDRGPSEAKYLYRVGAVRSIIFAGRPESDQRTNSEKKLSQQ